MCRASRPRRRDCAFELFFRQQPFPAQSSLLIRLGFRSDLQTLAETAVHLFTPRTPPAPIESLASVSRAHHFLLLFLFR